VNNFRSTLATVWRIAAPYFGSEDKFAGRLLLASVVTIELMVVAINVLLNQWNNRFYNALQEKDWNGFVREIGIFSILGIHSLPDTQRKNLFGANFKSGLLGQFS